MVGVIIVPLFGEGTKVQRDRGAQVAVGGLPRGHCGCHAREGGVPLAWSAEAWDAAEPPAVHGTAPHTEGPVWNVSSAWVESTCLRATGSEPMAPALGTQPSTCSLLTDEVVLYHLGLCRAGHWLSTQGCSLELSPGTSALSPVLTPCW